MYLLIPIISQWNLSEVCFFFPLQKCGLSPAGTSQDITSPFSQMPDLVFSFWFFVGFFFKQSRTEALTVIVLVSRINNSEDIVCGCVLSWHLLQVHWFVAVPFSKLWKHLALEKIIITFSYEWLTEYNKLSTADLWHLKSPNFQCWQEVRQKTVESYRAGGLGVLNIIFLCALNQPFPVIYGSWAQLGAALSSPSEPHFCCVGL